MARKYIEMDRDACSMLRSCQIVVDCTSIIWPHYTSWHLLDENASPRYNRYTHAQCPYWHVHTKGSCTNSSISGVQMQTANMRFIWAGKEHSRLQIGFQSLTSVTPSDDIWNLASASARQGELTTLQIRSSPLPLRRKSLISQHWHV